MLLCNYRASSVSNTEWFCVGIRKQNIFINQGIEMQMHPQLFY